MRKALGFLTVAGGPSSPDAGTLGWFPVAGAVIGAVVGAAWWAAGHLWPPLVAAALAVVADLAFTGMLHLDGLADSADGLLAHLDRDRRLAVMAEPTIGAFGFGVAVAVLLLRWVALASLAPNVLLVAGIWSASRTVMAIAVRTLAYARPGGGLATAFAGGRSPGPVAAGGIVLGATLAVVGAGAVAVAAVAAAVAAGVAVLALGRLRLGGYTGDVLGAAGMVAETVGILVAAARW